MSDKKQIKVVIKLQIVAGKATPAPPLGPALGQHGVNIMEFCKAYNAATADQADTGNIIPVEIYVKSDKSFTFKLKTPPVSGLILKELGIGKGSPEPNRNKVGKLSAEQIMKIVEIKRIDLNANDDDAAAGIIKGTARSMGVEVAE